MMSASPTPDARTRDDPAPARAEGSVTQQGEFSRSSGSFLYFFVPGYALIGWSIFRSPWVLITAAAIAMAVAFYSWLQSFGLKRAVLDVPTSKVRSAAQGYVELHGTIEPFGNRTLVGPLTQAPCVWYVYGVTEGRGKKETNIDGKTEGVPFLLRDETGTCLIDPGDACVVCDLVAQRRSGSRGYVEWSIRPGDSVYAIGLFRSSSVEQQTVVEEAPAQLRAWLRDPKAFFARFDTNRDGKMSRAELDAASEAARLETIERYTAQGGSHRLARPDDNRPYVVATLPHDQVAGYFGGMNLIHLGVFLASAVFLIVYWAWAKPG